MAAVRAGLGFELPTTLPVADQIACAARAEALGYSFVAIPEIADPESFVVAALIGSGTRNITIGTSIVQIGTRTMPLISASTATAAQVCGGRFTLGIGVSTPAIVERWHGRTWRLPLTVAEETLAGLRAVLGGATTDLAGKAVVSHGYRLTSVPDTAPPIWLAALNTRMLQLAARAADGVWLSLQTPHGVQLVRTTVDAAAASASRPGPPVALSVMTKLTDDPEAVYPAARRALAFYMSAPVYRRSFEHQGYVEEAGAADAAAAAGDRAGLRASISDQLLRDLTMIGDEAYIRARMGEFRAAGLTHLGFSFLEEEDLFPTLEAFAPENPA